MRSSSFARFLIVFGSCYTFLQLLILSHILDSSNTRNFYIDSLKLTMNDLPNQPSHVSNDVVNKESVGYDFVTLIHHDDMNIFVDYGFRSWIKYFSYTPEDSHVYAICTPKAYKLLQHKMKNDGANENLILVLESEFPFTIDSLKAKKNRNKPTWLYQQILKLYSYQILSDNAIVDPPIKPLFLVIDSDTIAVRPFQFIDSDGKPIYNIASEQSGAFKNDCDVTNALNRELFPDGTLPPAFPDFDKQHFTSITHMMMFNGTIVNEFLYALEKLNNHKPAWKVLDGIHRSVLSEWELYMAWVMKHHRDQIAVRQIPYVNWGNITHGNLAWLQKERDVFYATRHDDWNERNICCVNSEWAKMTQPEARFVCKCCPFHDCEHALINCATIGIKGCQESSDGLMRFPGAPNVSVN